MSAYGPWRLSKTRELHEALGKLPIDEVISLLIAHVVLRGQEAHRVVMKLFVFAAIIGRRIEDQKMRIALAEVGRDTADEIEAQRTRVTID